MAKPLEEMAFLLRERVFANKQTTSRIKTNFSTCVVVVVVVSCVGVRYIYVTLRWSCQIFRGPVMTIRTFCSTVISFWFTSKFTFLLEVLNLKWRLVVNQKKDILKNCRAKLCWMKSFLGMQVFEKKRKNDWSETNGTNGKSTDSFKKPKLSFLAPSNHTNKTDRQALLRQKQELPIYSAKQR